MPNIILGANLLLYGKHFIDGLAIASRLSKHISTVAKQLKQMLCEFNEGVPSESQMSWDAASNIHRYSYKASLTSTTTDLIPVEVKHEAVQKLKLLKRSKEEIYFLKEEMKNCLDYFQQRILSLQHVQEQVDKLSGCHCLVAKKIYIYKAKLADLWKLFQESNPGSYI